ncbi:MAG: M28 family peptidase [Lysobacterales bacterium]
MRSVCLAVGVWWTAALSAAPVTPTVIVDIHALGPARLQALKTEDSVRWSAEFGTELLLGVAPEALPAWLGRDGVRAGPEALAPDQIWIRDHVCVHEAVQPALAVVGGYEVLRLPAPVVAYQTRIGAVGAALPADGVHAREAANAPPIKAARVVDARISAIVARVDAARWFATLSTLASYNRNSFSPALGAARDYILSSLGSTGLQTETYNYTLENLANCGATVPPPIVISNPIGRKLGRSLPDEWIVVGAHYDSRNVDRCDGTLAPQPGANDNASGCAGVIELARVYASVATERSVLFMCFSGEEQGLWGSRRYVEALQSSGEIGKVKHMINLDMLGFDAGGALDARAETNATNAALLTEYRSAATDYAPELNLITSSNTSAGSDHWYFLQAGVPAVFTWENGASVYPHYHRDTDVPANMTNAQALAGGILKMDAAMLAQKAGLSAEFADGFE